MRKKSIYLKKMARGIFLMLAFLFSFDAMAQKITISGNVTDNIGIGLPGVSILQKGTVNGTVTNKDGAYTISTVKDAILSFSFIGMKTQEIVVAKGGIINVELKEETVGLNEVIVTGYQTQRKADLTGAVSPVKMTEIEDLPSGNIMKNIQGRIPGVEISSDGAPGSKATVRIRGTGTLNNNDALYVVDGVPTKSGMHELNPNDIETIQVLKDASSASIYGSRSANGVVIITTKKAKAGITSIDFDCNFSMQQYTSKLEPLNTYGRGEVFWQASVNDHIQPVTPLYNYVWNGDFNNPILGSITYPEYIDAAQTMKPADTKWFDEVSRLALMQTYNLTVSKGDKTSKMLFSLGYYDHDGIVKETNFQRINTRFNTEFKLFDGLMTIGENFTISYQNEVQINASDVLFNSLVQHPIVPVHTIDGGWGGPVSGMTDRQNPVRLIEDFKHNKYNYVRPFGNFYVEIEPVKDLKFNSSVGIDYSMFYARNLYKSYTSGFLTEPDNKVSNQLNVKGNWIWSNTLSYDLKRKAHHANFLLGIEQIRYKEEWFDASREGLTIEDMDYAYLSAGSKNQLNGGLGSEWALQSYFSKINYSFADKYLASATIRRDGSSRFGANNKYGNFPAFSLGWRISEEEFMNSISNIPYSLKLRASWGQNGNQEINDLARYSIFRSVYGKEDAIWDNPNPPEYIPNLGTAYDIEGKDQGQLPSGFITTQVGNEDLKWETTTQTNYGIDFTLYNNISGSLDYYVKQTDDILYYRQILSAVGEANGQYVNGGSIENRGFEFVLNYSKKIGNFNLDVSGNLTYLKNQVVDMPKELTVRMPLSGIVPNEAKTELPSSMIIGHSINSIYGYVANGLFQTQDDVNNHAEQPGKGVGRIRYEDINGPAGIPDGIVDNYDQKFIAIADPDFLYGLNIQLGYKQFSLDIFLQGIQGMEVYNSYKTYTDFASLWPGTNWGTRTLDAWTPENASSSIPKIGIIDNNNEGRLSTYFIENGSYLKLRNLQLGYTFNSSQLNKLLIKSARFYLQGQNLLTFKSKSFTGPDPENPNYAFPIPAIYTLGIKLGF